MPLLTLTVAYSFLAAARFALPPRLEEGPPDGKRHVRRT